MSKANFDGAASVQHLASANERHFRESFIRQKDFLLSLPDSEEGGVNPHAPSFQNLIRLLEDAAQPISSPII